jgi:polyhydroxyalkanoate synthase subunit PhaC
VLGDDGNVSPEMMLQAFRSLTPMGELTQLVSLLERLWDDQYVAGHRAMTGWATDHIPFPGATAKHTVQMLLRDNGLMTSQVVLGGDPVRVSDITVPFLSVLGTRDHIIPPAAAARYSILSARPTSANSASTAGTSASCSAGRPPRPPSRRSSSSCESEASPRCP